MVGWGWCFQICASSELQSGGLREGGGTREAGSTVAESLVVLYQVGTHQIRRRRRAARSLTSQEGWTPVRENRKREPGGFWGKSWSLTTAIFLPTRATWSGDRARFVGLFLGCTGLWTAGCWLAHRLHELKASTTMDLGISIFLIFVRCMYVCMYVCMVITYSRVWINRVRLPILLVVRWTEKMNIPLSPCVPENLVSRDGFSRPVPRQPAHLHTQAESGTYLRDSSQVPRRRPFMKPPYAIG